MKKSYTQLAVGCVPILLGFCSSFLFRLPLPLFLEVLLFIGLWLWLCFRVTDPAAPLFPQILRLCLPGLAAAALGMINEFTGGMIPALLARAGDFYLMSGMAVAGRFVSVWFHVITGWPYYLASGVLMTLAGSLTVVLKKKLT